MTQPEQPATPALTRKQLRELRTTGATPIITVDTDAAPTTSADPTAERPKQPVVAVEAPPAVITSAPLPRAAEPAVIGVPAADASVDLGVAPLTRRHARQQERIRTASVPVITPEVAAAHAAATQAAPAKTDQAPTFVVPAPQPESAETPVQIAAEAIATPQESTAETEEKVGPVVHPELGQGLLAGEPETVSLPPSFDQLISRASTATGSTGTGSSLIMPEVPLGPPLAASVTATGEVMITGMVDLPEGLGSTGHAAGTTDGKDVDAVLLDGELPAHSSPTPIAASAAVSTSKAPGEVIKPPSSEQGSRLMLTLAITAGVLALALVGVLILAFVTGVFG